MSLPLSVSVWGLSFRTKNSPQKQPKLYCKNKSTPQTKVGTLKRKAAVSEPILQGITALTFKDAQMRKDSEGAAQV